MARAAADAHTGRTIRLRALTDALSLRGMRIRKPSWKWILWTLAIGALCFAVLRWIRGGEWGPVVAMQSLTSACTLLVGGAVCDLLTKGKHG